jgi:hypothetical protein
VKKYRIIAAILRGIRQTQTHSRIGQIDIRQKPPLAASQVQSGEQTCSGVGSVVLYGNDELEAAKHPVPDGKFVKVACVHKSVPRIIE